MQFLVNVLYVTKAECNLLHQFPSEKWLCQVHVDWEMPSNNNTTLFFFNFQYFSLVKFCLMIIHLQIPIWK